MESGHGVTVAGMSRRRSVRKLAVVAVVCAVLAMSGAPAGAAPASRRAALGESHARWATPASRVGEIAPNADIAVRIYLRGPDAAGLEAVARSVSDPKSSAYRHF